MAIKRCAFHLPCGMGAETSRWHKNGVGHFTCYEFRKRIIDHAHEGIIEGDRYLRATIGISYVICIYHVRIGFDRFDLPAKLWEVLSSHCVVIEDNQPCSIFVRR